MVVVQRVAAPNHVTEELNTVQLTVRVLGSRVVHEADLGIESCHMSSETVELPTGRQTLRGVHRTDQRHKLYDLCDVFNGLHTLS